VGHPDDEVAKGLPEAEHLHPSDAATDQRGKQGGGGRPQVKLGLGPAPHGLLVGGVPPLRADLKKEATC